MPTAKAAKPKSTPEAALTISGGVLALDVGWGAPVLATEDLLAV